ncbi:MAG: NIPSNAP family protein [bacterium]|nr:NIPSNAP family protein [bacterium]MDE0375448.1 NIPSNAP family protein [bacterium]
MNAQLRIYDIKPGMMEEFAAKVDEELLPIRLDHGFRRSGPWIVEESYQYVWIVHHDGDEPFEEVDKRYYADPRRDEMSFNPMDYITRVDARMLTPIQ